MTIKGFRRVGEPPDAHRVTVLLGNRDQDLKEWCWHNPDRVGELFRQVMRRELLAMGELTEDDQVSGVAAPVSARMPPRAIAQAAPVVQSAPGAPITPVVSVATQAPPPPSPPVDTTVAAPGVESPPPVTTAGPAPVVVGDAQRQRIGRLVHGNKDFA